MRRWLLAYLSGLRFPALFAVTVALLAIDLLVPDALPFVDEFVLALIAALISTLKADRGNRPQ